jgi:hypothetical protein
MRHKLCLLRVMTLELAKIIPQLEKISTMDGIKGVDATS